MIIVKKTGHLKYKNYLFRCSLGKSGIKKKIKEGDNITPKGIFKIVSIYYRPDKITKIKTSIKTFKIKKNMGWCDDPFSENYNKEITINKNFLFSFERLFRKDNIYDLIAVLNYNSNPVIKNKGSAIFIHVAKRNYKPPAGCIALKKKDLLKLTKIIKLSTKILIK